MPDWLLDLWNQLPVTTQDLSVLTGLLLPMVLIGSLITRGFKPGLLVRALLQRYRLINLLFISLIAVSVGLGASLVAQERAIRTATARAADKFTLIVTAPGSEMNLMLATVYLQPTSAALLSGEVVDALSRDPRVVFAAPMAFGDNYRGAPVVGTTAELVRHLSAELEAGRLFANPYEAVAGARVHVTLGTRLKATHGLADDDARAVDADVVGEVDADDSAVQYAVHHNQELEIVGRMQPTGTPWDRALVVPIEAVWLAHGLGTGHDAVDAPLGPPFDVTRFPGASAIVVHTAELSANYALQAEYTRADTMAFFPGAVLARLHGVLGNLRQLMSALAVLTQSLVALGVITGLVILMRLFNQRLALLRALGAPSRFVVAVVWCYTTTLLSAGTLLGLPFGYITSSLVSRWLSQHTDILVRASLSWTELNLAAGFLSVASVVALLPAWVALNRSITEDLRS